MFRVALCDDEAYFLEREQSIIQRYMSEREITYKIDTYSSGKELIKQENALADYDVIFLDINMDELDGIETAKRIRTFTKETYIVFVTAFITYSLEGYKVNAIRYLLKDEDTIDNSMVECLSTVLTSMNYTENQITFHFKEGTKRLIPENILYAESNLHRVTFTLISGQKYIYLGKLDECEKLLNSHGFCRIHKSFLVNMRYMVKLKRYEATLLDGRQLNVSQPKYMEVREQFIYYRGEI